MDNKNLKKYFIYLATALILPTVFQIIYGNFVDEAKDFLSILVFSLLFFIACIIIIFIIEFIRFLWNAKKSKSCIDMLREIDKVGNSISFSNGIPMFDILEKDYALYETVNENESKYRKMVRNSRHIIYHSTTAKEHLNWIEFVFWGFLKKLHAELGCDVIISLHYDEKARETGLQNLKERDRYNALFNNYSSIAKKMIGNDITVLDEENFHTKKKYAVFYAYTFHNKFVKCITNYAAQMEKRELDYKGFMRKISYIESVFPVIVLSKKLLKRSRLYILDRELAHEVWHQSPFSEYKDNYGVFFITAQTIRNSNGNPIRIFSPEDTVNITDDIPTIINKLKQTDYETKAIMLELLSNFSGSGAEKICLSNYDDGTIDSALVQVISEIKSHIDFNIK